VLEKLPSELSTGMKRAWPSAGRWRKIPGHSLYEPTRWWIRSGGHAGDFILRLKKAFHKTSIVVTHDTHLAKKLADVGGFLQEGR